MVLVGEGTELIIISRTHIHALHEIWFVQSVVEHIILGRIHYAVHFHIALVDELFGKNLLQVLRLCLSVVFDLYCAHYKTVVLRLSNHHNLIASSKTENVYSNKRELILL